jgi:hypothetical protein
MGSVLIWHFAGRGRARIVSRSALKLLRLVFETAALRSKQNPTQKLLGRSDLENFTGNAGGAVSRLGHDCGCNPKIGVPEFFLELV